MADGGFVAVTVTAQTASAQITRVSVTVMPANASADLTRNPAGTFSGTLDVPVGAQTVTANAWAGTTLAGTGTGSALVVKGQTVQVFITVPDDTGPAPTPDHSPVITSLTASSNAVLSGDQVSLAATAMDADGDAITFSWTASPAGCGTFATPASASTTWTAGAAGTCAITITVTARGKSDNKSTSIAISPRTATPALVQHIASSSNPRGIGISGNNFRFYLPNPVRQGNCLILGLSYPSSTSRTVSISDTAGNDWTGRRAATAQDPHTLTSDIYVLPNAKAGVTQITVAFDSILDSVQYTASEFYNVDPNAPVNGFSAKNSATTVNGVATLSSGSFTPGNNDANGGNLIWSYFANNSFGNGHPTDFTAGTGFTSLHSDIGWAMDQGIATASQYALQANAAAIDPSIRVTATATDTYNALSVALKAAVAGAPPPAQGIRIVRQNISSLNVFLPDLTTWDIEFPSVGNLLVVTTPQASVMPTTSVTDSKGNTWVLYAPDNEDPQIWYAANATPDPSLKVTFHMSSPPSGAQSALMYDIVNADSNPLDASAERLNDSVSGTHLTDSPVITPGSANGLTIAAVTLGQGPISQLDTGSPAGAIFDYVYYDNEIDTDLMDNADGRAHYYNGSDLTAEHWNWLLVGPTDNNNYASTAVHFKTAPVGP